MSAADRPSFAAWLGLDPGCDECYASDYIEEHGAPAQGCLLELSISSARLACTVLMTDAAQWTIPELGVQQESYAHAGFSGNIGGLLAKIVRDVDMMRAGYPPEQQPAIDQFLLRVDHILSQSDEQGFQLRIRDPSGLSVVTDGADDSWASVQAFDRSFTESDELGIIAKEYQAIPQSMQLTSAADVAALVSRARKVVCLSGAGISVESGIPPFRSNTASSIWGSFDASKMTVQGFNASTEVAEYWWDMKHSLLPKVAAAQPNDAHLFFGYLHAKGKLGTVITQNIDSLHQKGGAPRDKVLELHGHMRGLICADNAGKYNPLPYRSGGCEYAMGEAEALRCGYCAGNPLPRCPLCDSPLRTETVMFNQMLPEGHFAAAVQAVSSADLMFVIGSSLIVEPANTLPSVALRLGIPIVMINLDATQYDEYSTALVRGPAGGFLASVKDILEG